MIDKRREMNVGAWIVSLSKSTWERLDDTYLSRLLVITLCVLMLAMHGFTLSMRLGRGRVTGHLLGYDAIAYYVYARSALFDHDLDFANEYAYYKHEVGFDYMEYQRTVTGLRPNPFSIGPSVLWIPAVGLTWCTLELARALGITSAVNDGYNVLYEIGISLASVLYGLAGLWLIWRAACRVVGVRAATVGALTLWFASNAVYYVVVIPTYSHAMSFFAVALLIICWLNLTLPGAGAPAERVAGWARLGLAGGLVALVRWQEGPFIALVGLATLMQLRTAGRLNGRVWRGAAFGALVCGLTFLPQLLAWHAIYGKWLTVPQGAGFMNWTSPAVWQILFVRNGLFLWTPVVALAVVGCAWLWRRWKFMALVVLAAFCLQLYLNAIVVGADLWAGASFSHRRFVGTLPFLTLSLSALVAALDGNRRIRLAMVVVAAVLVVLNLALIAMSVLSGFTA